MSKMRSPPAQAAILGVNNHAKNSKTQPMFYEEKYSVMSEECLKMQIYQTQAQSPKDPRGV